MTKEQLDERFVEALFLHREAMYRVAYAMLRSAHDAQDAVSEATIKAYANLRRLRDWGSVRPWLMQITVNASHQAMRRRKREQPQDISLMGNRETPPEETPFWMYVDRLPDDMRLILTLRFGEDLPVAEIARILRLPVGTVSSRISRAKQRLREDLMKEEERHD